MAGASNYDVAGEVYMGLVSSLLAVAVLYFMYKHADRQQFYWHTYISTFVAYFSALGILLIVPIDMTLARLQRETDNAMSYDTITNYMVTLTDTYRGLYWPTLVSANIVLVLLEEYNCSGYFSVWGRMCDALFQLTKQAALAIVAGIIFVIILKARGLAQDMNAVVVTAVALSNTYGLIMIAFLLGYGLIELPKQTFMAGSLTGQLQRVTSRAAYEFRRKDDAALEVADVAGSVMRTKVEVERSRDKNLENYFITLLADIPEGVRGAGGDVVKNKWGRVTVHELAALRRKLNARARNFLNAKNKVDVLKEKAFYLEDILQGYDGTTITWINGTQSGCLRLVWELYLKPCLLRLLGLGYLALSITVFMSEMTLFKGQSSGAAAFTRAVEAQDVYNGSFTALVFMYMAFVMTTIIFALSQLRLANMMEVMPGNRTNHASMSFHARLICQFSAPLAYNFLGLFCEGGPRPSHDTSQVSGTKVTTAFTAFYGKLNVVPFIGDQISMIIPILMIVVGALHGLNILNRLLQLVRLAYLQFGDVPVSKKDLSVGKEKLHRAREQELRSVGRNQRLKQINDGKSRMFGLPASITSSWRIPLPLFTTPISERQNRLRLLQFWGKNGHTPSSGKAGGFNENDFPMTPTITPLETPDGGICLGEDEVDIECPPSSSTSPGGRGGKDKAGKKKKGAKDDDPLDLAQFDQMLGTDDKALEKMKSQKVLITTKPDLMEGYVEKKADQKPLSPIVRWNKRYFMIVDGGRFMYWDTQEAANADEEPKWEVDLKLVGEVVLHTNSRSGEVESKRVDVETPEGPLYLRCKTEDEAVEWMMALVRWRNWMKEEDLRKLEALRQKEEAAAKPVVEEKPKGGGWKSVFRIVNQVVKIEEPVAPVEPPPPPKPKDERPPAMAGWLKKKSDNEIIVAWNDRYFVVDRESPYLKYYMNAEDLSQPKGAFDIREIVSVELFRKNGKDDDTRFVISLRDNLTKVHIKGNDAEEVEDWMQLINAWMTYYKEHVTAKSPVQRVTLSALLKEKQAKKAGSPPPPDFLSGQGLY